MKRAARNPRGTRVAYGAASLVATNSMPASYPVFNLFYLMGEHAKGFRIFQKPRADRKFPVRLESNILFRELMVNAKRFSFHNS